MSADGAAPRVTEPCEEPVEQWDVLANRIWTQEDKPSGIPWTPSLSRRDGAVHVVTYKLSRAWYIDPAERTVLAEWLRSAEADDPDAVPPVDHTRAEYVDGLNKGERSILWRRRLYLAAMLDAVEVRRKALQSERDEVDVALSRGRGYYGSPVAGREADTVLVALLDSGRDQICREHRSPRRIRFPPRPDLVADPAGSEDE